jgi:hypothetical protein
MQPSPMRISLISLAGIDAAISVGLFGRGTLLIRPRPMSLSVGITDTVITDIVITDIVITDSVASDVYISRYH